MDDNIVKIMSRTLPYNAPPLIALYHGLDPEHSVVTGFQCTIFLKKDASSVLKLTN